MKNRSLLSLSIVLFSLFILLTFTYELPFFQAIDLYLMEGIPSLRLDWVTSIMFFLAWLGSVKVIAVLTLCLIVLLVWRERSLSPVVIPAVVMGGTAVLNNLSKQLINRARPDFLPLLDQPGFSFPSGHTMAAVSLCGVIIYLVYLHMKHSVARVVVIITFIGIPILMGVSRIYLGVHFFTDIVGGMLLSVSWLLFSVVIVNQFILKKV
ncbi:phosphatase PAP2 family protein [Alkalicoccobacillus porphyridii]|nr:phosphatase PAP2 family protein [Alkalicoccobacillus porphyridii]